MYVCLQKNIRNVLKLPKHISSAEHVKTCHFNVHIVHVHVTLIIEYKYTTLVALQMSE